MKIEEILKIEDANADGIYLFKSGIFWRAYNRSAFLIIKEARSFQPIRKYMKTVKKEVVYIGFPDTILEDVLLSFSDKGAKVNLDGGQVYIELGSSVSDDAYQVWFNGLGKEQTDDGIRIDNKDIVEEIKRFPIMERTPLETQAFIWELQKKIHGYLR